MRLGLKQTRVTDIDSARALTDRPEGPGCIPMEDTLHVVITVARSSPLVRRQSWQ
jgi:hypothetical protein